MSREWRSPARQQVIAKKVELPRSGNARIQHTHGTRRCVSGVGEVLAAELFLLLIELCERF